RQAFGGDMFRQSAQQSRNARSGGSDEMGVRALEVGKPIRRELAGGQKHAYRIGLSSDQFMKVIVEQQGIDVVVQVSGPDGKQILEFDSESRTRGQEVVSQVAEAGGDYQLVVEPKLREAPAGAYEIRIEELRPATENDRTLQESRNLYQ